MRRFDGLLLIPLAMVGLAVTGVIVAMAVRVPFPDLAAAVTSDETRFAVLMSLRTSIAALILSLAIGIPAAYVMARRPLPGKAVIDTLLDIPLIMPPLVAGVGLLMLLSRSMLGGPLARMGLDLLFSPSGAVAAQTFIAVPVVIRSVRAAFDAVGPGYGQAAATLGASPAVCFFWIDLPLATRGILAGAVLAWARALGEFGATLMVAGATRFKTETLPMAIYLNIATGDIEAALACALVLMGLAFILLLGLRLISRPVPRKENG